MKKITGMIKGKILIVIMVMMLLISFSGISPAPQLYYYDYENVLGTSFLLKVAAYTDDEAQNAEMAALSEIDRLAGILSSYDQDSEFNRWQNTVNIDVPVSTELFEVLSLFDEWRLKTGGALNASAAIAADVWDKAAVNQILPANEELSSAVNAMAETHWELNAEKQTARRLSTSPLVLNSFVKSYILSKASEKIMNIEGITGSVMNIGGDILVSGELQEKIRIADPKADAENDLPVSTVQIENRTIATSGNYRRGFMIEDEWYSHIIDVRTALPATDIISATVIADNATDAGAMATAFNILKPEESIELADQMKDVNYLIITKDGRHIESSNWKVIETSMVKDDSSPSTQEIVDGIEANSDFEVEIEIELSRFEGRFRRPFVAVWIENEDRELVRNIAVWYNNPRWLPDLRRWYSKNSRFFYPTNSLGSVSSATRSPGRYTLKWDGLDMNGNPVTSGLHTIYIEASREHGTYQLLRHDLDISSEAKRIDLTGGIEISSAAINYYKVKK